MADVALMMKTRAEAYVVIVDEGRKGPIATVYKGFRHNGTGNIGVAFGSVTDPKAVGELLMVMTSPVQARTSRLKMGVPDDVPPPV